MVYKMTEEHKEKIRKSMKKQYKSGVRDRFKITKKANLANTGSKRSEETKRKISLAQTGENNSMFGKGDKISREKHGNWKGGKIRTDTGYIKIKQRGHPYCDSNGYVMEHRLVMEEHLGRYLKSDEVVHHINEITDDNRLENLKLMSNSEHIKYHRKQVRGGK